MNKTAPSVMNTAKFTERASWPGLILTASEWNWFDTQDGETQRDYYRWQTRVERVEA